MKSILKWLARATAQAFVLPPWLLYRLSALVVGRGAAFPGWSQAFSLLPGLTGTYLRWAFYRWALAECGVDACIGFGTTFSHPTARVGPRVYVGLFCSLGDVTLEEDVLIASHVSVMNGAGQHGTDRLDVPIREQSGTFPRVTIGCDSWIGERAIVMADVGRHCIIAAGSVVTKPVPDYAIAVGSPARVVRFATAGPCPTHCPRLSPLPESDGLARGDFLFTGPSSHVWHRRRPLR
jgi:acetyltransferase-like isoleucine patch superfamily enzyme